MRGAASRYYFKFLPSASSRRQQCLDETSKEAFDFDP